MASFNRVVLMGNVTRDVELKYLQSGTAVTEIGMAMNDRRKTQSGEWVDEPVFVDVTLWGRTAEIASEYLSKGAPVFIEGRLKYDTWEADGQKRSKLRVVGERMQLIGPKGDRPRGGGGYNESEFSEPATANTVSGGSTEPPQDDIPF
ncbi:MAG: single-stranded DNA-binding protein [Planctomycetaceae bacterium]|nr:single-stranded DNA-binding protein [Planctomycetales bacterium]MCB9872765.1 single-stranded DNA-binding protein [Planctomycetaceae bacterium]MCB9926251.1 single-stranded DNA-binding protein [Planctomycetaceae bacterium]